MIKKFFDCPLCFNKNSHKIPTEVISGQIIIYNDYEANNNLFLDILNVPGSVCQNKLKEIEGSEIIADEYITLNLHLAIAKIENDNYRLFFTENRDTKISIEYELDELRELIDRIKEILFIIHSKIAEKDKTLYHKDNYRSDIAWLVNEEVQEIIKPFYKAINKQRKGAITKETS